MTDDPDPYAWVNLTWRERALLPAQAARDIGYAMRERYRRPVLVEHAWSRQGGADALVLQFGPWWLDRILGVIDLADDLTGHRYCGAIVDVSDRLLERHAEEVDVPLTEDVARAFCAARGWSYWPDAAGDES